MSKLILLLIFLYIFHNSSQSDAISLKTNTQSPKLQPIWIGDSYQEESDLDLFCTLVSKNVAQVSFSWYKGEVNINELPDEYKNKLRIEDYHERGQSILSLSKIKDIYAGNYTCQAENLYGFDRATANLVVTVELSWIVEPSDIHIGLGQKLSLGCLARGKPEPSIQWSKLNDVSSDVSKISPENSIVLSQSGNFDVAKANRDHSGYYECRATNKLGHELRKVIKVDVREKRSAQDTQSSIISCPATSQETVATIKGTNRELSKSGSLDRKILKHPSSTGSGNNEEPVKSQVKSTVTRDSSPATKTRRVVKKKSFTKSVSDDDNDRKEVETDEKPNKNNSISSESTNSLLASPSKTLASIPSIIDKATATTKDSIPRVVTKEEHQKENITINKIEKNPEPITSSKQVLCSSSKNPLVKSSSLDCVKSNSSDNQNQDVASTTTLNNSSLVTTSEPFTSRLQFTIPPPPRQNTSSIQSSVVTNAKSRIYDSPKHPSNISRSSLNSLPNTISSFKPPKQVNVSKAREKWEGGEPFILANNRRQRNFGKKSLLGTWSVSSASQQSALAVVSNTPNHTSQKSSVKQLLARGSVLERVQQFEKSPVDENLIGSYESDKFSEDLSDPSKDFTHQENKQSNKQTYKSRVSLASDNTGFNQDLTGNNNKSDSNLLLRRGSLRRQSSQSSTSNKIPKFYHPDGKPNTYEIEIQNKNIIACFDKFPDRKAALVGPSKNRNFHAIALACGFSEYYKEPIYIYVEQQLKEMSSKSSNNSDKRGLRTLRKASSFDSGSTGLQLSANQKFVTCDQFLVCWRKVIGSCYDAVSRFVHILTLGQRKYLIPEDFVPLIQSVIEDHPGLSFLRAAPDFHMRYIQTVVARIFFCINKSWTGKITLSELRRSNLLPVLSVLSQEEDINQITDYFSYEHFYVIYCKFWTLDQDHDLLISKDDLARHNDAAISSRIIDRIFLGIVSREVARTGKLSYTEFVWFLIAEEDKKHPRSIEYWFRLMDLDGDGFISMYEMEYFYYEQMKRLELMGIEALPFQDCACKILDLVNPNIPNKITLSDLKRSRMTPIFFDTFINLEKYLEHESREFASARDATQDGVVISDWDRYASEEYELLVSEESNTTLSTTNKITDDALDGTSL